MGTGSIKKKGRGEEYVYDIRKGCETEYAAVLKEYEK
jgi:hypothetical protein